MRSAGRCKCACLRINAPTLLSHHRADWKAKGLVRAEILREPCRNRERDGWSCKDYGLGTRSSDRSIYTEIIYVYAHRQKGWSRSMSVSCVGLTLGMPGKPLWSFLWAERRLPCLKWAPHALHSSGLAPVWICMCCMKFCLDVNILLHAGHGNLLLFRCMHSIWRCKLNLEGKSFEHSGQTKLWAFIFLLRILSHSRDN